MQDFETNRLVQLCIKDFENQLTCLYSLIFNLDEDWDRFEKQKLNSQTYLHNIHIIYLFESISHMSFTPDLMSRLIYLKVILISAIFNLYVCDFTLTLTTFIKQLKSNSIKRILHCFILFLSSLSAVSHSANVLYFTLNSIKTTCYRYHPKIPIYWYYWIKLKLNLIKIILGFK